jgi:hypothetical protein
MLLGVSQLILGLIRLLLPMPPMPQGCNHSALQKAWQLQHLPEEPKTLVRKAFTKAAK